MLLEGLPDLKGDSAGAMARSMEAKPDIEDTAADAAKAMEPDNSGLSAGNDTPPPGESKDLKIIEARWGAGKNWIDVTAAMKPTSRVGDSWELWS